MRVLSWIFPLSLLRPALENQLWLHDPECFVRLHPPDFQQRREAFQPLSLSFFFFLGVFVVRAEIKSCGMADHLLKET